MSRWVVEEVNVERRRKQKRRGMRIEEKRIRKVKDGREVGWRGEKRILKVKKEGEGDERDGGGGI